jgi:hypothetical protein
MDLLPNSRSIAVNLAILLLFAAAACAQVAPTATNRGLSITAGGLGSVFQPDYAGNYGGKSGIATTSPNRLYGVGAYIDMRFTRWVQIEAEGRWLRFNELEGVNEDNYLIGPRLPIQKLRYRRFTPYGKFLVGWGRMDFENGNGTGRFTALAPGGGVDMQLNDKFALRIPDFEYQLWPTWYNHQTLKPYGASIGISYKIF